MSLINRVGMLGRANVRAAMDAVSQQVRPGYGKAVAWDLEFAARDTLKTGIDGLKRAMGHDPDWLRHLEGLDEAAHAPAMGADSFDWNTFAQEARRGRTAAAGQASRAVDPKLSAAYATLGLREGATPAEVRMAWKAQAIKWHPDTHPDKTMAAERMKAINHAYTLLKQMQGDA